MARHGDQAFTSHPRRSRASGQPPARGEPCVLPTKRRTREVTCTGRAQVGARTACPRNRSLSVPPRRSHEGCLRGQVPSRGLGQSSLERRALPPRQGVSPPAAPPWKESQVERQQERKVGGPREATQGKSRQQEVAWLCRAEGRNGAGGAALRAGGEPVSVVGAPS